VKKGFQVLQQEDNKRNMFEVTQVRLAKSKKLRMVAAIV
jgi:hypothetical protein